MAAPRIGVRCESVPCRRGSGADAAAVAMESMTSIASGARSSRARGLGARSLGARSLSGACTAAILVSWLAIGAAGCAATPDSEEPGATEFFAADATLVLEVAEDLLARQGYVFEESELSYGMLVGQQLERVEERRSRDSFPRETLVRTQVVIEASARGDGTDIRATFSISLRRATGERRTWSPETPPALKLQRKFYVELREQVDFRQVTG